MQPCFWGWVWTCGLVQRKPWLAVSPVWFILLWACLLCTKDRCRVPFFGSLFMKMEQWIDYLSSAENSDVMLNILSLLKIFVVEIIVLLELEVLRRINLIVTNYSVLVLILLFYVHNVARRLAPKFSSSFVSSFV